MHPSGTDGLERGMEAIDLERPIMTPVGKGTLGRILNVTGDPVDGKGAIVTEKSYPIHRSAPDFDEQSTEVTMLETGIKVIDLLIPFPKGGKIGLFGGAGSMLPCHHNGSPMMLKSLFRTLKEAFLQDVKSRAEP